MHDDANIQLYRAYWRGESDAAYLYGSLASAEHDPAVQDVFRRLSDTEKKHAAFWAARLATAGVIEETPPPRRRARLLAWIARLFGPAAILPYLARIEVTESHGYDGQPDAVAAGMPADEYGHARIVQAAAMKAGGLSGRTLATIEGRSRSGDGNALRAAVLGANDGLVSNLSLVMGVAGAAANERAILLTGLAGLVAGACSMAMGEWLSVSSAREMVTRRIEGKAAVLAEIPDIEREDVAVIFRAKGFGEESARRLAERLFQAPGVALDTIAREELGIDPSDPGGSPASAAAASFGLFALGAIFPVLPFFALKGAQAFLASFALSGLALGAIGAATSLFTGRTFLFSITRQVTIGLLAALLTFTVGRAIGVSVS
ncbi:VIT1/CCC1 transporter family protein [Sphingobium sp.]|uniref:VIT1/CCC1 transporter family protein n=1 Tax=Sphingobium sp. TaxID=1912891 RepID=UPI000DB40C6E|nr:VIT1/CCC1 transporter family protein [Sphingobium sp.]PZU64076.1 MAG: rubrerythrin family protein [Sphingobium sp.]